MEERGEGCQWKGRWRGRVVDEDGKVLLGGVNGEGKVGDHWME